MLLIEHNANFPSFPSYLLWLELEALGLDDIEEDLAHHIGRTGLCLLQTGAEPEEEDDDGLVGTNVCEGSGDEAYRLASIEDVFGQISLDVPFINEIWIDIRHQLDTI